MKTYMRGYEITDIPGHRYVLVKSTRDEPGQFSVTLLHKGDQAMPIHMSLVAFAELVQAYRDILAFADHVADAARTDPCEHE